MSLAFRLRSVLSLWFKDRTERPAASNSEAFLVFANTGEVIQAERILAGEGLDVRVMAPPPALRTGCDMVLVIPLIHSFRAVALLETERLAPLQAIPAGSSDDTLLSPVSLFQTKDYGAWLMVRAANMKITVEKASGRIVNVSGGGCPDVPYLAALLIGKNIHETDPVREHAQTLCGYALHLAVREMNECLRRPGEEGFS